MKLPINDERLISDVQADFNHYYPYLKLEFFPRNGNVSKPPQFLSPGTRIDDIVYTMQDGTIQLSDQMTVSELERIFNERFGLRVQVFRKSGNIWLETTRTDKWTLKVQNDHGREISA